MDSRRGNDGAVRRISKKVTQQNHLDCHLNSQRENQKGGVRRQFAEEFDGIRVNPRTIARQQNSQFEKSDGAQGHLLAAPHGLVKNASLVTR